MNARLAVSTVALALAAASLSAASPAVDAAFKSFWDAATPDAAAKAGNEIVTLNVPFDDAYARLKHGRDYAASVPRGVVRLSHHFALGDFNYTLDVPQAYNPAQKYQVRVQLHGGVTGRDDGAIRGTGSIGQLAGVEQIYVLPISWKDATWWSNAQLENMNAILDSLKRTYNVDENRVVLSGVSDGATANYYFAMRDTTPFAAFLPLNGALAVLQNESMKIDGELFPQNLMNKPFFMVNGGKDPLYPPDIVEPYIDHLKRGGLEMEYHQEPNGVHNTTWWPEEKDAFEAFVHNHPRNPFAERLTWETDMTGGTNRAAWLVIDRLTSTAPPAPVAATAAMPDLNIFRPDLLGRFGLRVSGTTVLRAIGGSAASTFFFEPGDVITAVQGEPVSKDADLSAVFATLKEGIVRVQVQRAGTPTDLSGFYRSGEATAGPLFAHAVASGRVDLARQGNTIRATTRNVAEFTLLLSRDAIDFSKPVQVIVDGRTAFDGRVRESLETLMKWAARDNDRTALIGAELHVNAK